MHKKDRRTFIRVLAYHLVKYKAPSGTGELALPVLASLKDIGAGGVCLRASQALPVACLVQLKINFPSFKDPLFTLAKVVWVKPIKKDKNYEIGLQFVEIEDSLRDLVDKRLKFVYGKSKKRN